MQKNDINLQNELVQYLSDIGLNILDIQFLPLGEESFGWKIKTDKEEIFLKYCSQERITSNLHRINKLLLQISYLDFVIPPFLLNNKTELPFKDGYIYAYPFVNGKTITIPNNQWEKDLVDNLLDIMNQVHSIDIKDLDIPKESFEYNFKDMYLNILKDWNEGLTVKEVNYEDLLKLEKVITEFNNTSQYYKNNPPNMVLTHGDITGTNIIITEMDLKLIDWDEAKIAPIERDYNFLNDNPNLLNSDKLDKRLLDYYGDMWSLESILTNLSRIQHFKEEYGSREDLLEDVVDYLEAYVSS